MSSPTPLDLELVEPADAPNEIGWTGKPCPHCNGTGERNADRDRCDHCAGTGDEYSREPKPMTNSTSPTPAELQAMQAMRALAEKATPGPWHVIAPSIEECQLAAGHYVGGTDLHGLAYAQRSPADAAFIAAANPQAVLALIDALVSARAALEKYGQHKRYIDGRRCFAWDGMACNCGLDDARAHLGGQDRKEG